MCHMMQGTVDKGTAAGLRVRLGAAEMGGKTGTTNDNADAWFMGYVPQLEAGVWVGCDDRFIRLGKTDGRGFGNYAARPIWEYFFKKVYADKSLALDKDAIFVQPADNENEINSADILNMIDAVPPPGAEGEDQGVGKEQDFKISNREYIPPESQPVKEDNNLKKDTVNKSIFPEVKIPDTTHKEKKKGFLQKLFGKKENKPNE